MQIDPYRLVIFTQKQIKHLEIKAIIKSNIEALARQSNLTKKKQHTDTTSNTML